MFLTAIGPGSRPSAMAGALVPFPQIAGLARALGFTQMLVASFNTPTAPVAERPCARQPSRSPSRALVAILVLRQFPGNQIERRRGRSARGYVRKIATSNTGEVAAEHAG
jgi:hypothetical protein